MYSLLFDENALEALSKFPKDTIKRIYNKLEDSKENPHHFFKKLEGRNDYRLRVGDYRIIADINNNTNRIEITLIRHRKNVYEQI
jgi:mRNA interferase RelE/StbE